MLWDGHIKDPSCREIAKCPLLVCVWMLTVCAEHVCCDFLCWDAQGPEDCSSIEAASTKARTFLLYLVADHSPCLLVYLYVIALLVCLVVCNNPVSVFSCIHSAAELTLPALSFMKQSFSLYLRLTLKHYFSASASRVLGVIGV